MLAIYILVLIATIVWLAFALMAEQNKNRKLRRELYEKEIDHYNEIADIKGGRKRSKTNVSLYDFG